MIQALLKLRLVKLYDFLELDTFGELDDIISIGSNNTSDSEDYSIFYSFENVPID